MNPDVPEQLLDYLSKGGWIVMTSLVAAAMVLWYCLGYRMFALRRGRRLDIRESIERDETGLAGRPRGIVDAALVRGLTLARAGELDLRSRLDESFSDFDAELDRYASVVRAIVMVSPLLGLLGTVSGMIETFDSLGDMSLFSQSGGIAGGISQALFTTQMGLAVALPGLVVGRILDRRQVMLENELTRIKSLLSAADA